MRVTNLDSLIAPLTREAFLRHYNDKTPAFVDTRSSKEVAALVSSDAVSAIVQQGLHPDKRIVMYRGGKAVSPRLYASDETNSRTHPHLVRQLLSDGASLVVNGIDELLPEIGALAQGLELELSANVWANAYITAGEGGALDVHFDDHDVIVLQISGAKRWILHEPSAPHPLHPGEHLGAPPEDVGWTHVLGSGDILFLPRGVWHRTEVVASPSVHLTFGIGGVTGLDAMRSLLEELADESLARQYLPVTAGREEFEAHERALKDLIRDKLRDFSLADHVRSRDLMRRTRSRVSLWAPIELNESTRLSTALRRTNAMALVEMLGEYPPTDPAVGAHPGIARQILELILSHREIAFGELLGAIQAAGADASSEEIKAIALQLIEAGLLNSEQA